jgi:hypothetical protein
MLGGKACEGRQAKRAREMSGEKQRNGERWSVAKMEETDIGEMVRTGKTDSLSSREIERCQKKEGDRETQIK